MSNKQTPSPNPMGKWVFLIFAALAVVIAGVYFLKTAGENSETTTTPTGTRTEGALEPAESGSGRAAVASEPPQSKVVFEPLVGRWLREDGGYVVDISEVMPDGTLKAAYLNPRPIHVSKAVAVEEGGNVKVGIELQDTGYPGCLYTLVFNRELKQLQGTYFQAAQGQTYEVTFVRMPEE